MVKETKFLGIPKKYVFIIVLLIMIGVIVLVFIFHKKKVSDADQKAKNETWETIQNTSCSSSKGAQIKGPDGVSYYFKNDTDEAKKVCLSIDSCEYVSVYKTPGMSFLYTDECTPETTDPADNRMVFRRKRS